MYPQKISIGITGGIGSGKSYVCRLIEEHGVPVFYCDPEARLEMQQNASLRDELQSLVGPTVYSKGVAGYVLNKHILRTYMMHSPEHVALVNSVVHPYVLRRLQRWIQERPEPVVATECALLFEAGFNSAVSLTVQVSAPRHVRLERVVARDGVSSHQVSLWMSWQMDERTKRRLSDMAILNDGKTPLRPQIDAVLDRAYQMARESAP